MASDTNTKTLLKKVVGGVSDFSGSPRLFFERYHTGGARRKYHPARLIAFITGVNLVPVLLLIFALIFLGEYRGSLIRAELELTKAQSDLAAAILKNEGPKNFIPLLEDVLPDNTIIRLAYFDENHRQVIGNIPYEALQKQDNNAGWLDRTLGEFLAVFFDLFSIEYDLPAFPEIKRDNVDGLPGIQAAYKGRGSLSVWSLNKTRLVFSSAAPVNNGALFLIKPATEVDNTFTELRNDIFRTFFIIVFISVGVSLFLVQAIATPLRRLADAAESIRYGSTSLNDIPDMSGRGDEIGELSVALRSLVQALWERMDNIERFAADVSHELKNPITSMQSALETLGNVKAAKDRNKLLDILKQDVRRLDRLVTDISQATKLDIALSREQMTDVDLERLLNNIKDGYIARFENIGLKQKIILENLCKYNCSVVANRDRLTQVFTNLLDNALSFSPEKGRVTIQLDERPTAYEIRINDEGPGISKGKETKIFERFYSERPEDLHFGGHSGLGLSICQQIVHAHGGILKAENNVLKNGRIKGAVFTVILPKAGHFKS